jgi:hypothetical protein
MENGRQSSGEPNVEAISQPPDRFCFELESGAALMYRAAGVGDANHGRELAGGRRTGERVQAKRTLSAGVLAMAKCRANVIAALVKTVAPPRLAFSAVR